MNWQDKKTSYIQSDDFSPSRVIIHIKITVHVEPLRYIMIETYNFYISIPKKEHHYRATGAY